MPQDERRTTAFLHPMLEILICTIDGGIARVPQILLSRRADVCYLVSWQYTSETCPPVPAQLTERADVRVIPVAGKGLSANRNHAFGQAKGDILLLADDDVRYADGWFDRVTEAFGRHPEADVICFQAFDEAGKPMRAYPEQPYRYEQRPYGSYVCSWEIALRNRPDVPRFDERFGLGAPFLACGEEEVWVETVARKGGIVLYEPIPIVSTNRYTTGMKFLESPAVQRSKGAVLYYMYGFVGALLRCAKHSLTIPGTRQKFVALRNMWDGIRYIQHSR